MAMAHFVGSYSMPGLVGRFQEVGDGVEKED